MKNKNATVVSYSREQLSSTNRPSVWSLFLGEETYSVVGKIDMPVLLCTHLSLAIIRWKLTLIFLPFHLEKSAWKFSRLFCHYLTACVQFSYDTADGNKSCLFCHFSKLSNAPQGSWRLAIFFFTAMRRVRKRKLNPSDTATFSESIPGTLNSGGNNNIFAR